MSKEIKITRAEFQDYEDVRTSGATNMYDVRTVQRLSGLAEDKIMRIMKQYDELTKKYPGVRE